MNKYSLISFVLAMTAIPPAFAQQSAPSGPVAVVVTIPIPAGFPREKVLAGMQQSVPQYQAIPGLARKFYTLSDDGKLIRRKYKFKDFVSALQFLLKVGAVAEQEQHHPDLHLTGYRNAAVELTTHAIGGLSANDFIVAAKIDKLS